MPKPCNLATRRERYRLVYGAAVRARSRLERRTKPLVQLVQGARQRARRKGLPFNLSSDRLVLPTVCPVLGIPIRITGTHWTGNSPTLDRTDPKGGYTLDNVQIISWRANCLKRDATTAEIEALAAYMQKAGAP